MIGAGGDESLGPVGEGAAKELWIQASEHEKTLAVKTGDIRGVVKGKTALTRSCAGQQNLPSNGLSVSMRMTIVVFRNGC